MTEDAYIAEALACYLTDPPDMTSTNRTEHVRRVSQMVGRHIWTARRPQSAGNPIAITIQEVGSDVLQLLLGEDSLAQSQLRVDIWSRDPADGRRLASSVRIAMSGFQTNPTNGATWGNVAIGEVVQLGRWRLLPIAPADGNDNWTFRLSSDWSIRHCQLVPESIFATVV
jgi:hypothetical protein